MMQQNLFLTIINTMNASCLGKKRDITGQITAALVMNSTRSIVDILVYKHIDDSTAVTPHSNPIGRRLSYHCLLLTTATLKVIRSSSAHKDLVAKRFRESKYKVELDPPLLCKFLIPIRLWLVEVHDTWVRSEWVNSAVSTALLVSALKSMNCFRCFVVWRRTSVQPSSTVFVHASVYAEHQSDVVWGHRWFMYRLRESD